MVFLALEGDWQRMSNESGMDRRTFLGSLGLAAGAAAVGFSRLAGAGVNPDLTYNLTNPNLRARVIHGFQR
jgi:hypothetical protein